MSGHYFSGCAGKHAFASPVLAMRSTRRRSMGDRMRPGAYPYRCGFCGRWHLTSKR